MSEENSLENSPTNPPHTKQQPRVIAFQETFMSGPIPPAQELVKYEQITPGLADRIIKMAENEALHRHQQEDKALNADINARKWRHNEITLGQVFAFLLTLFTVGAGTYAAINYSWIYGTVLSSAGLVAIVIAFIRGRDFHKK